MARKIFHWLGSELTRAGDMLVWGYDSIDLAATFYAEDISTNGESFDFNVYESLLPTKAHDWAPHNWKARCHPCVNDSDFPFVTLKSTVDSIALSRIGWMRYFKTFDFGAGTDPLRQIARFRNPMTVARRGRRLLAVTAKRKGLSSREFAMALILVGIGTNIFCANRSCISCFRNVEIGSGYCAEHSQSKFARQNKTYAQQAKNARTGRAASQIFDRNLIPRDAPEFYSVETAALSGIFFGSRAESSLRNRVLDAFEHASLVKDKLPVNFAQMSLTEMVNCLRATLDPNQWRDSCWPDVIQAAQSWYEIENIVAPGGPPKGPRKITQLRLQQIKLLIGNGKTKKEIAAELGITPQNLSKLFRRYKIIVE
jgi:hypothetical protein